VTRLDLSPLTGRTHQLRRHLAALAHPIVGDTLYGPAPPTSPSLCLVAVALMFEHPVTGETLSVERPEPRRFERVWRRLVNKDH